ncbi:Imm3 family immunity protein [Metabacillus fastidiosus]|uniref:Imm3 family immunity protein n=1 Tax=Metabacillus fastidiosus TaxID=1458 RepID=UPI002DB89ABC|nr:Imm3 family immunity protein [Metabacillus fastidiosus]MEC2077041.1 Imm3 family immunity protein [Metabacillus fastidiosus]
MLSSYKELSQYIVEDFDEFLNEGLSISQVTEKLLVEYYHGIVNSKVEKLVIYLRIALLSIERAYLREDIKTELMNMINELETLSIKDELGSENTKQILLDIQNFKNKSEGVNRLSQ